MQRQVIDELGATVIYQHQLDANGDLTTESLKNSPPGSALLRHFLGDDLFATVAELQTHGGQYRERISTEPLGRLTELREVHVGVATELSQLEGLENLQKLETIYFANCKQVTDFSPLSQLSQLKNVYLSECDNMVELPFQNCFEIEKMAVSDFRQLGNLALLEQMTKLSSLRISSIKTVDLSNTPPNDISLLSIRFCDGPFNMSGIRNFRSLKTLEISTCSGLESISELSQLKNLESLSLIGSKSLNDFTPIASLSQLKELDLSFCEGLTDLGWISELQSLERLDIAANYNLKNWQALKTLKKLKRLNLSATRYFHTNDLDELKKQLPDTMIGGFAW